MKGLRQPANLPTENSPTYPHQVYRVVCSHLRNLASAVDQYSSSQPTSLIFDPTSECNLNKFFFKLRERQSHLLARKKTPVGIRKRDVEACVLTPSIPVSYTHLTLPTNREV